MIGADLKSPHFEPKEDPSRSRAQLQQKELLPPYLGPFSGPPSKGSQKSSDTNTLFRLHPSKKETSDNHPKSLTVLWELEGIEPTAS